jgi:hypothetical protein
MPYGVAAQPDEVPARCPGRTEGEVVAQLEPLALDCRATAQQRLAAVRSARALLEFMTFDHGEIDAIKRKGRA